MKPNFEPIARYHVLHETHTRYQHQVTLSQQYVHLTPLEFAFQHVQWHHVTVQPHTTDTINGVDYFGNSMRYFMMPTPHQELIVQSEFAVDLAQRPTLVELTESQPWEYLRNVLQRHQLPPDSAHQWGANHHQTKQASQFLYASPHVSCSAILRDYAALSYTPNRPLLEAAFDLTQRIFNDFEFDATATDISTPVEEVFRGRRGVCQDFAHLMIACIRSLGLPARYVSGYILTHPPAGQPRLIGADASHAWVSVYCPTLGWIDFDPTNRCLVQHEHITLGFGRDFSDVTPMRGIVLGGGEQQLEVKVTVTPL